jgi:hypothetical protein
MHPEPGQAAEISCTQTTCIYWYRGKNASNLFRVQAAQIALEAGRLLTRRNHLLADGVGFARHGVDANLDAGSASTISSDTSRHP